MPLPLMLLICPVKNPRPSGLKNVSQLAHTMSAGSASACLPVRNDGNVKLCAGLCNAILKDVCLPQPGLVKSAQLLAKLGEILNSRELNLNSGNLDLLGRPTNTVCAALGQTDAAQLAGFDVLVGSTHGDFNGSFGIHPRGFEDIQLLLAVENFQALVDGAADVLCAAVGLHLAGD